MPENHEPYLRPTLTVDSNNPVVQRFAAENSGDGSSPREQAVALYYAVRDGIRYDPYRLDLSAAGLRASTALSSGRGWCVPKAALLAACCRARDIPAALGFADVRNHLSTERMRRLMETDVFYWHGYTSIFIDGQWLKATPAFNVELCEKFRLHPLEFDGRTDSIYHPYDRDGQRHMEYLHMRGEFPDMPLQEMRETFNRHYPNLLDSASADFDADVAREASAD